MSRASFRPAIRGLAGAAVAATALLGAAACTPTETVSPAAEISRNQTVTYGVIVSMRPTVVPPDTLASILRAVDVVGTSAAQAATMVTPAATGATMEFIVREDTGNTVSVVQANDDNLRPGDHVILRRSAHIRVVRAPPG